LTNSSLLLKFKAKLFFFINMTALNKHSQENDSRTWCFKITFCHPAQGLNLRRLPLAAIGSMN